MKAIKPTDLLATNEGCSLDLTEPKQLKQFAKQYCGVDLLPWQYDEVVVPLFGWLRPKEQKYKYQIRTAHLWMPKKSGKSFLLAIICLYVLLLSNKKVKIILLSGVKEQCKEIWDCLESWASTNKTLEKRLWFRGDKDLIQDRLSGSTIKVISGKGDSKSGFNADLVLIDEFFELHPAYAQKTWDKIKHAIMARTSGRVITISHANFNRECPAYICFQHTRDVLSGRKAPDVSTYGLYYGVDENDDWQNPDNWWPQLPGCPDIIPREFYYEEFNKVKDSPVESVQFRTLHLNQMVGSRVSWLPPSVINQCYYPVDEKKFLKKTNPVTGILGVDAAKSYDLYCYTKCFEEDGYYHLIPRFFIPEVVAEKWEKDHHVLYTRFKEDPDCNLSYTKGDTIDHLFILDEIRQELEHYEILEVRYDPTNWQPSRQILEAEGIRCVEVIQNRRHMGPCFKLFETLARQGKLRFKKNPLFDIHLDNCVPKLNRWDELEITKESDINKIDAVDSACIALSYWVENQPVEGTSYASIW